MRLSVAEIINQTHSGLDKEGINTYKREKFFNEHKTDALMKFLQIVYNGKKWVLPEGPPPYTPYEFPDAKSNLYTQTRRLYLFQEGTPVKNKFKLESLFVELLEGLDKDDAELVIKIKDGYKPYSISMAKRLGIIEKDTVNQEGEKV